jgi:hypothetical protein
MNWKWYTLLLGVTMVVVGSILLDHSAPGTCVHTLSACF